MKDESGLTRNNDRYIVKVGADDQAQRTHILYLL
jgi:hypothetical protein